MHPNIDSESEFNSLLVEYINTFNLLEINLGLCILHIVDLDYEFALKKVSNQSFKEKIDYFCDYLDRSGLKLGTANNERLRLWSLRAQETRSQRNIYCHGVWSFLPHLENCIELRIPQWFKDKAADVHKERMSMAEFRFIVEDIKECFEGLMFIREKYGI